MFTADNGTLVFNPALFKKLPYDPAKDFRAVGLMARFPLVLAVRLDSESHRRQGPGRARPRRPGDDRLRLAGRRLAASPRPWRGSRARAASQLNHVPYKGAAPALNDLVGGHIELMIVDYPSGSGQIRAGKIRPLAVCSATPPRAARPTCRPSRKRSASPDFEAYAWQGLVVPAATPDPEVERLSAVLAAAVADPKVTARLEEIGLEPLEGGPAEMQALIDAERAIWVPLIRELGITLD